MSEHDQVPSDPADGERFTCSHCGATSEFVVLDDGKPGEWVDTTPPPSESTESDARCPVCGETGVRACVDADGREMDTDHAGRPPFFPPGFDRIFPPSE